MIGVNHARWRGSWILLVMIVAVVSSCESSEPGAVVESGEVTFYFFTDGIEDGIRVADIDLDAASFVIVDSDIAAYVWEEQQILLNDDEVEELNERLRVPGVPFIMEVSGTFRVRGASLWEHSATSVSGPQLRCNEHGFWLTIGEWPDASALSSFGLPDDLVIAVREHMEETDRLR